MARFLALFLVALAAAGSVRAVDLQTFLSDPKYALLAAKVREAARWAASALPHGS
jgi:hypothetical protein